MLAAAILPTMALLAQSRGGRVSIRSRRGFMRVTIHAPCCGLPARRAVRPPSVKNAQSKIFTQFHAVFHITGGYAPFSAGGRDVLVVAHHAGRLLRPARLADRPQAARRAAFRRARAPRSCGVVPEEWLEQAQDDATPLAIRDQEARRARHRHRRRDAPRELLQPLRHRARRRRPRQPRHARWTAAATPTRCRASSGKIRRTHAGARCATWSSCARNTDRADQDHRARPVHHGAAGAERLLQRRRTRCALDYAAARQRGDQATCSPPAPTSCRSTSPTCRRAPRRRASTASRRSTRALEGVDRHDGACTSASATRRSIHARPDGLLVPAASCADCSATQISIETAQSKLDCVGAGGAARQARSCWACSTCPTNEVETPETVADRIRRALAARAGRSASSSRPTAA